MALIRREPETEIIYDTNLKTIIFQDKHSRSLITQKHIPFKTELEPWYEFIPKSWGYNQNYLLASGFKYSCGAGVPIFYKLTVNDIVWGLARRRTPFESGYWQFFNTGGRPKQTWRVKIEYGRTVNGKDIVDVTYEGTTVINGKSGQGPGYPVKILTWDSRPELGEEPHGCWFMLILNSEYSEEIMFVLRDLDSGELLFKHKFSLGPNELGYLYALNLEPPYGERHLRFSIESIADQIYDYFDTTVTLKTITPPPPPELSTLMKLAVTLAPIAVGALISRKR